MQRLIILMYHIIASPETEQESKYCCLPAEFEKQMQYLSASDYRLVDLNDVSAILRGELTLDSDAIAVTFDDGFDDFYLEALPILRKYEVPATLFMVSDSIGGFNHWMVRNGSPKRNLLSSQQLNEISKERVIIGSHTKTHPKLTEISHDSRQLAQEISTSKLELENKLGLSVNHFAYPYGLYNDLVVNAVREAGYSTACSTRSGFNRIDIDPHLLRRIEVFGQDSLWQFKQKLKFGTNEMSLLFPVRYYLQRVQAKIFS